MINNLTLKLGIANDIFRTFTMPITDVPFGRPNLIQDRYANLLRPGMRLDEAESSEDEEELAMKTQEYAAFLK